MKVLKSDPMELLGKTSIRLIMQIITLYTNLAYLSISDLKAIPSFIFCKFCVHMRVNKKYIWKKQFSDGALSDKQNLSAETIYYLQNDFSIHKG